MVVTNTVEGEVEYNDGNFAAVQTVGTEGIEKDLLLEESQIHRKDTDDTKEEFRRRFPVGKWLHIKRTMEVTPKRTSRARRT